MKKTVKDIFSILIPPERSKVRRLIIMDVVVSLLDIIFLAALIYVIQFYTAKENAIKFDFFPFSFFNDHPLSLIITFFILFALKMHLDILCSGRNINSCMLLLPGFLKEIYFISWKAVTPIIQILTLLYISIK